MKSSLNADTGYKNTLNILKAFFINIFTLIIPYIPRPISEFVSGFLGFTAFILLKSRRRAIIGVLKVVKPDTMNRTLIKLACRTLINYAKNFADFLRLYHMKPDELINITEVRGTEHLKNALSKKKGVILVTAHIGNWELGSNLLAGLGFPVVGVAESAGPGKDFYKLFKRYREHFGTKIISLENKSIVFKLRKLLKQGYMIGLIGDRDLSKTGIEVNFFGKRAVLPRGPAFLSLTMKCPVHTVFFVRKYKGGRKIYYAYIEKEIDFIEGKNNEENIRNLTQIIAKRIERTVAQYPDQWFSFPPPWEIKDSRETTMF